MSSTHHEPACPHAPVVPPDSARRVEGGHCADMLVYDGRRRDRIGIPEAVLCLDKCVDDVVRIVTTLDDPAVGPVLFTRMSGVQYDAIKSRTAVSLDFELRSQTAFLNGSLPPRDGRVGIVTAGTSDLPVALEAQRTLQFNGVTSRLYADVGVAGLWRLLDRIDEIRAEPVVIVVAGMDAALGSVVGGLVASPVIAVPTSTGYGAAHGGQTALQAMLASCAQGVVVTNVDNGFGAACAAARILATMSSRLPLTEEP